jgi:hypothetical protein
VIIINKRQLPATRTSFKRKPDFKLGSLVSKGGREVSEGAAWFIFINFTLYESSFNLFFLYIHFTIIHMHIAVRLINFTSTAVILILSFAFTVQRLFQCRCVGKVRLLQMYNLLSRSTCGCRRGFWIIGFINHLQIATTSNYGAIADFHTLQIATR